MTAETPDQPTSGGDTPAAPTPEPAAPAPAAPATPPADDKASGGMRTLAVLFILVLAFAAAVMIMVGVEIGDTPTCDAITAGEEPIPADGECFDGASGQKSISVAFAYASGVVGAIAALLGLAFAITGRRGRLLVRLAVAAIVLGGLSILIGSI